MSQLIRTPMPVKTVSKKISRTLRKKIGNWAKDRYFSTWETNQEN